MGTLAVGRRGSLRLDRGFRDDGVSFVILSFVACVGFQAL
jgi:hypothetical protein